MGLNKRSYNFTQKQNNSEIEKKPYTSFGLGKKIFLRSVEISAPMVIFDLSYFDKNLKR